MIRNCKICNNMYETNYPKRVLCGNLECRKINIRNISTKWNKQRVFPKEIINCIVCNNGFQKFKGKNKITCSEQCSKKNDVKRRNIRLREIGKITDVIKNCKICGDGFKTTEKYCKNTCSLKCKKINLKQINLEFCRKRDGIVSKTITCKICHKEFTSTRKEGQILCCSETCQYRYRLKWNNDHITRIGKANNLDCTEYRFANVVWVKCVRHVLGSKCVICGSDYKLNIHHIFYKKHYPQLSLIENNGIPLCKEHHNEVHRLNPMVRA